MEKTDKIIHYIEEFLENDYLSLDKSLRGLLKDYKRKSKRLDTIIKQSDRQQSQLVQLNEELDSYKNELEKKVEEEIAKRQEKEKMLYQQSKLAAMGEMMDAVAHQWAQPINVINMGVDLMGYDFDDGLIDQKYIEEFQQKMFLQIQHMTNTLNEFRSFFRPSKGQAEFDVKKMIDKVLLLIKDEMVKNQVTISVDDTNNFQLLGVENEFKHLVLNMLSNAKDAFNDNGVQDRKIWITIDGGEQSKKIIFRDNAGGIPPQIIDTLFQANVTTKAEGKGTGIGLYMSSQIAMKHNGELKVENVDGGAQFTFELNNF
jgi:C4-dicarboxylate-specific signal transduction histidine kinase